ncbi:MAG TPA: 1-deoxy-D-xylulose-5-phosphate reductoisomerase [Salinivirgaceae bacterium]|nr:1-deoxy-D-xylulose-5-phosphate reductoisomerase [Salinivirgaceae bacterium]
MKKLILLGSTGSIGTQTLDVVREFGNKFRVVAITANNSADTLIEQAREFKPKYVVIGNKSLYEYVRAALYGLDIKVLAGHESINNLPTIVKADMVVAAMVGFSGLIPTMKAIDEGMNIALANKETLVVAGDTVIPAAKKRGVIILPVDSEHSAIFQCLVGESHKSIEKLILTASGGPFRNHSIEQLEKVTPADALKHPNWNMGAKITIDSATMMNKGLEVIEAHWLFDIQPENIDVVVHPQSIIHSMVQFVDGNIKAHLSLPDMRLPIQYALNYPDRTENSFERYKFNPIDTLTFEKPDTERFPCLQIAYDALKQGGNYACIINAANEVAVAAFLKEKIGFMQITEIITETLSRVIRISNPSLNDYIYSDQEARLTAEQIIEKIKT